MSNNISPKTLNILKASLPFFPGTMQRNLSYFVKINEFNNMFNDLNNSIDATISACEVNGNDRGMPFNLSDLLYAIKPYLDKNERDMINMFMNISTALNLYKSFGNNPTSLLNSMLASGNNSPIGNMINNNDFSTDNIAGVNNFSNNNFNDTASAINNILQGINTVNNNNTYTNNPDSDMNSIDNDMFNDSNSISNNHTSSANNDFINSISNYSNDFNQNSYDNFDNNFEDNDFSAGNADQYPDSTDNNTNYNHQIDASIEALKSLIFQNQNEVNGQNQKKDIINRTLN